MSTETRKPSYSYDIETYTKIKSDDNPEQIFDYVIFSPLHFLETLEPKEDLIKYLLKSPYFWLTRSIRTLPGVELEVRHHFYRPMFLFGSTPVNKKIKIVAKARDLSPREAYFRICSIYGRCTPVDKKYLSRLDVFRRTLRFKRTTDAIEKAMMGFDFHEMTVADGDDLLLLDKETKIPDKLYNNLPRHLRLLIVCSRYLRGERTTSEEDMRYIAYLRSEHTALLMICVDSKEWSKTYSIDLLSDFWEEFLKLEWPTTILVGLSEVNLPASHQIRTQLFERAFVSSDLQLCQRFYEMPDFNFTSPGNRLMDGDPVASLLFAFKKRSDIFLSLLWKLYEISIRCGAFDCFLFLHPIIEMTEIKRKEFLLLALRRGFVIAFIRLVREDDYERLITLLPECPAPEIWSLFANAGYTNLLVSRNSQFIPGK